jgi:predicted transcriptional regulator YdeE
MQDRERFRTVTIPTQTYRSVKLTAAEIDKSIMELLAAAWANYFETTLQKQLNTNQ